MNLLHRKLCSSQWWARAVARNMPRALKGVDLGDDALEIGPGFGANTRVLVDLAPRLTVIEIDEASAAGLRAEFGRRVDVVHGDGADMPFPDDRFSAVVCFTMLHHVPSARLQDRLFAEALRVLRPGGLFRGVDSRPGPLFRLLHVGDTMVTLDPGTLGSRLTDAGFTDVGVRQAQGVVAFTARKPR